MGQAISEAAARTVDNLIMEEFGVREIDIALAAAAPDVRISIANYDEWLETQ